MLGNQAIANAGKDDECMCARSMQLPVQFDFTKMLYVSMPELNLIAKKSKSRKTLNYQTSCAAARTDGQKLQWRVNFRQAH